MDMRSIAGVLVCLTLGRCALIGDFHSINSTLHPTNASRVPSVPAATPETNLTNCQSVLDALFPPTMHQVPWHCICSACSGNRGQKGDRGNTGPPGGSSGPRGPTGLPGPTGFMGRPGMMGEIRDEDDFGPPEHPGPIGDKGSKGEKGDSGLVGPVGAQGLKGATGQCPEACEPVPGPKGATGVPGPVGERGLPGLAGEPGQLGLKGDPGTKGAQGIPGASGQKGDEGPEGLCNCHNGAPGAQGVTGEKGTKGDMGLEGPQGAAGATGPKGNQGDMGMKGMPGPCSPAVQSAFSAALTASYPLPNRPVAFKHAIYNINQNYNIDNGVYTAPVNGTYVFSYHLQVSTRMLKVGLFHNFEAVVRTTTPDEMNTASQQVVLSLTQGDWVWVQVRDNTTNGMYTGTDSSSTFSGFLLYPDRCDEITVKGLNTAVFPLTNITWGTP